MTPTVRDAHLRDLRAEQRTVAAMSALHAQPPSHCRLRVLLAEDSATARFLTQRSLDTHGLVADEACDGLEAIDLLAQRSYDLLLLDLSMPRLTGHGVLAWMSDHLTTCRAPAVVVISSCALDEVDALASYDIFRLMPKPLKAGDLADLLHQLSPSR